MTQVALMSLWRDAPETVLVHFTTKVENVGKQNSSVIDWTKDMMLSVHIEDVYA